jgi:hypothetical protein
MNPTQRTLPSNINNGQASRDFVNSQNMLESLLICLSHRQNPSDEQFPSDYLNEKGTHRFVDSQSVLLSVGYLNSQFPSSLPFANQTIGRGTDLIIDLHNLTSSLRFTNSQSLSVSHLIMPTNHRSLSDQFHWADGSHFIRSQCMEQSVEFVTSELYFGSFSLKATEHDLSILIDSQNLPKSINFANSVWANVSFWKLTKSDNHAYSPAYAVSIQTKSDAFVNSRSLGITARLSDRLTVASQLTQSSFSLFSLDFDRSRESYATFARGESALFHSYLFTLSVLLIPTILFCPSDAPGFSEISWLTPICSRSLCLQATEFLDHPSLLGGMTGIIRGTRWRKASEPLIHSAILTDSAYPLFSFWGMERNTPSHSQRFGATITLRPLSTMIDSLNDISEQYLNSRGDQLRSEGAAETGTEPLSAKIIVGIAVGFVLLLFIVTLCLFGLWRHHSNEETERAYDIENQTDWELETKGTSAVEKPEFYATNVFEFTFENDGSGNSMDMDAEEEV